jgi:hypothetical protein
MIILRKRAATVPDLWLHASIVILTGFLLSGVLKAQDLPANCPTALPPASTGLGLLAPVPQASPRI